MFVSFPVVVCLVAGLSALAPLALASPPDPIWIGGLFDAGDSDDVIVAATSAEGASDDAAPHAVTACLVMVGIVPSVDAIAVAGSGLPVFQGRAPPSA